MKSSIPGKDAELQYVAVFLGCLSWMQQAVTENRGSQIARKRALSHRVHPVASRDVSGSRMHNRSVGS